MAERLSVKDGIQEWINKINAILELQNVDGAFVNSDTSWDNTVFTISGGKVRSGTNIIDVPGASKTLPVASISVVGVDVLNQLIEHYLDGSVPATDFIPLYVVTTNNTRITSVEDARTWAYEDSGAAADAVSEHEGKADPHSQYYKDGDDISLGHVTTASGADQELGAALNQRVIYVDTIADLQALPTSGLVDGQEASAVGSAFKFDQTSDTWVAIASVNVEAFGADPTGSTPSHVEINEASLYCFNNDVEMYSTEGSEFLIGAPVDFRRIRLNLQGTITSSFDDEPAVILGGRAQTSSNPKQYLKEALSPTSSPANPTIRVVGAKGQHISVERSNWVQLWADSDDEDEDGSIAYSDFNFKFTDKITLDTNPSPAGTNIQWINENKFHLERCRDFWITGTYHHNNNRIYGGAFETSSKIDIDVGRGNIFYDMRFEGSPSVRFGQDTDGNVVEYTWYSSFPIQNSGLLDEDLGRFNFIVAKTSSATGVTALAKVDKAILDSGFYQRGVGVDDISLSGDNITLGNFSTIYQSSFIKADSTIRFTASTVGLSSGGVRIRVRGYDSSLNEVTGSTDDDINIRGVGGASFGDSLLPSSDTTGTVDCVINPVGVSKAEYVTFQVTSGGNGLECLQFFSCIEHDTTWSKRGSLSSIATEPSIHKRKAFKVNALLTSNSIPAQSTDVQKFTFGGSGLSNTLPLAVNYDGDLLGSDLILRAWVSASDELTIAVTNPTGGSVGMGSNVRVHVAALENIEDIT